MDTRYPWLPKDEYLRRNGITTTKKIDDNYLNRDDFDQANNIKTLILFVVLTP